MSYNSCFINFFVWPLLQGAPLLIEVGGDQEPPGNTWRYAMGSKNFLLVSNYSIIGVTLNTKLDTLWLSQVGGPMEGLTKKYDTSPESWVPGAKPGVGFMLIASILCLPSQFENCTFCRAEYSEILPFYAIWQKIGMSCKLSGKTKFSMASCYVWCSEWQRFEQEGVCFLSFLYFSGYTSKKCPQPKTVPSAQTPPPPDACSKSNVFSYIVKRVYPL